MARQKGIFKVEGTLGGVTFYDSQDGMMAREKGGIAKDPSFARTRENGEEFARAASAGKVIRDSMRAFMANASDNRVVARMSKAMFGLLSRLGCSSTIVKFKLVASILDTHAKTYPMH